VPGLRANGSRDYTGDADRDAVPDAARTGLCVRLMAAILCAHLVPVLRALGTAMLAGASVASIVLGLAAQNTLGNLIAGVALLLYDPFATPAHDAQRRTA